LLESRLLRQTEAGEIAFLNALPDRIAQVLLERSKFHEWSIARAL
jgi:hypothetical protein